MGWLSWLKGSKDSAGRRQQVEHDGVHYCSVCGKRKASKPAPGNDASCSDSCMRAMKASALMHGMMGFGVGGSAQAVPQRKTMFCMWCGSRVPYPPSKVCSRCEGSLRP